MREAAFSLIGPVEGAAVLDLFAGSGAMGLEALSRGAASCVFVERDREAARVIQSNLEKLAAHRSGRRQPRASTAALRDEERAADGATTSCSPTRRTRSGRRMSRRSPSCCRAFSRTTALVVVETAARVEPELPLDLVTSRRYGSARITVFSR